MGHLIVCGGASETMRFQIPSAPIGSELRAPVERHVQRKTGRHLRHSQYEDPVLHIARKCRHQKPKASFEPWPEREQANEGVARGRAIFERESCIRCHSPATYMTRETYDVGLRDERGHRRFNPPSLRGLRHGGPYFHHGRTESLKDVLGKFQHQLPQTLSADDEAILIKFLDSL